MLRTFLFGQLLLLLPTAGTAQPLINPTTVEFVASVDHAGLFPDNSPRVTSYEVQWFASGGVTPVSVQDIGKPTPDGTNKITVVLAAQFTALPLGSNYTVKVVAKGPSGDGVSAPSNPFERAGPVAPPTAVLVREDQ